MRLKKTNQTNRTTYTYTFTDTDDKGKTFIRKQTLRPGEYGVTEIDIKLLHSLDDSEVYINIKNMRPPVTDEQKAEQAAWLQIFKADFLIKYGYEPTKDVIDDAAEGRFPKNWNLSLNIHDSDDDGDDTSDRHAELADPLAVVDQDDALPADVRRMREIVSTCTSKQQEAYRLVYIEGFTETEAAWIAGCSQPAIKQRLNGVIEKIRKNF